MQVSRLGLLALLLHASVGLAQVNPVLIVNVNGNMNSASGSFTSQMLKNTCVDGGGVIPINWAAQTNDLLFWTFDSNCGVNGGTSDGGVTNTIATISNTNPATGGIQKSATIQPKDIVTSIVDPPPLTSVCTDVLPPPTGTVYVCVTQDVTNIYGNTVTLNWYMTLTYNMNPLPPPTAVDIVPGDTNLLVNFNYDSSSIPADYYTLYLQPDDSLVSDPEGNCTPAPDAGTGGGLTDPSTWPIQQNVGRSGERVNNLIIGQCYDLVIRAFAVDGTPGLPSLPAAAAPIELLDYWRLYHLQGGQDPGGIHCQEAGGGLSLLALVAPVLWVRRRKRAPG